MSSIRKLEVEVEVKSEADKFWEAIKDSTTIFPKAFPDIFSTIQLVEGDGKSVGSVRLIELAQKGSHVISSSLEKIEAVDDDKKTVEYSVSGEDIVKFFKNFKAKIVVTPSADGTSIVKWECEYEKVIEAIPDPMVVRDFTALTFHKLDAFILNESKQLHKTTKMSTI